MRTADDFLNNPVPALLPAQAAFPAEMYPDTLIGGVAPPVLPHRALVLFEAPALSDLPPVSSLYARPYPSLTSG